MFNADGTRVEPLAQQVIDLLFCKIYDENSTGAKDMAQFRWGLNEKPIEVLKRVVDLFDEVKVEYPDVFGEDDRIELPPGAFVGCRARSLNQMGSI